MITDNPFRWWVDSRNRDYYICSRDGIVVGFSKPFAHTQKHNLQLIVDTHNRQIEALRQGHDTTDAIPDEDPYVLLRQRVGD